MKTLKFLALSIFAMSTTLALANNEMSEERKTRHVRATPAPMDPAFFMSLQAARQVIHTRNILKANYEDLEKAQRKQEIAAAKAQRKQRNAERKERAECAKKIKMINNLPANDIDTLNVAKYMQILFLFPQADNPTLEKAVIRKMKSIQAEGGPRQFEEAQDRKIAYLSDLDDMYFNVAKLAKKFEVKYGQRQVVQKSAPLHVKEIFKAQKSQTRKFVKRIEVWNNWNKVHNMSAAAA